jgi:hypothetical protein
VRFAFSGATDDNAIVKVEGTTDLKGEFVGEGYCRREFGTSVTKDSYYESTVNLPKFTEHKDGKWQPWNPIAETVLRPVGQTIALYAKSGWIEIPIAGKPCGYDLDKGDWVTPYGKGMVADLVFDLERRYVSRDDFDVNVELKFSKPLDGIQEVKWPEIGRDSVFKWPREAPENEYISILKTTLTSSRHGYKANATEKQAYFIRVRTVEQDGKIVSARYGKIRGGFELAPSNSKTCKVKLSYYYNPTSLDRNLEWDTKRDLFSGLSDMETPREP